MVNLKTEYYKNGFFGEFGGRFVAEILKPNLDQLDEAFNFYINDKSFLQELKYLLKNFVGRPTPLIYAKNSSDALGGAKIYLKLEGLANTGAHKINNAIGQALLAKKMGKKRIIAETGAGQHGLATASACARLGLECEVFMGSVDIARQRPNVMWMELFGAKVTSVETGTKTLKDAVNAALREWTNRVADTHYLLGSALGPSPYPIMVKEFQSVIGKEVKKQINKQKGRNPDYIIACVGGGSNSIGVFSEFINNKKVNLIGVEAGGKGPLPGQNAARITGPGSTGIVQGYKSLFLQDEDGQLIETHSISAGLDYAGIGPELAHLAGTGRIQFTKAMDDEVIEAFKFFAKHEGIVPAMESSHALAEAIKLAPTLSRDKIIVVNVSGRGDKDIFITAPYASGDKWFSFLKEEVKRDEQNR